MRAFVRLLTLLALFVCAWPAFAQKAYVREDLAGDAARLEEQVRKDAAALTGPLAARPAADARRDAEAALQRKDFVSARALLGRAVAASPRDGLAWLDWARATRLLAAARPDESWRLNQSALAAAYLAYQRAATPRDEAAALALLGATHNDLSQHRLALNAWRAGLEASDTPALRAAYERLRAERGFRVVDYKVDSDAASPRVCVRFSEPLARGKVDFAPFVAISGASNGAISSEDQQLCVEGLRHGEKYSIVVRQGLPSSVGETLLKSADYEVYVKDRSPQVRFTGRNYVLPRVGQEGVPVVSVNADKVAVDILRIGDRNLLPTLRSDEFLGQLSGYRARAIVNEQGVRIWSGALDVRRELNKDVVTAFPVAEAVGRMEPGVYVMVARAGERPPAGDAPQEDDESFASMATQWFVVSDLGLTGFSGADGVHGFVRSLATAEPVAGVQLRLVARNNEVLATLATDASGHVRFDPGLSRGTGGMAPSLIAAMKDDDYGFLDLGQAPFDLTDRGVKGRVAARALDAFVYPERGVYRSGETVNVSALLRDAAGAAMAAMPVTLVVKRPDGVEYRRERVADQGLGGRAWSFPLLPGAAAGTWRVQAFADPRSPAIGEASFLVEDYVPERLDVVLKARDSVLAQGEPARVDVEARYLYGAPGAGLEITGELVIGLARGVAGPGLAGYVAGLEDESFETLRTQIEEAVTTDPQGRATVEIPIPQVDAPRPVEAKLVLRAGEPGGRAVERTLTLPIRPRSGLIAVKKNFEDLSDGATATFDVAALSPDGARAAARGVQYALYRVSNDYQWYNSGGRWGFERVKSSRKIADGRIDVAAGEPAKIAVQVGWGAHRLDLVSDGGALSPTSVKFNVGWSGDATADTPDLLDVTLDKTGYAAGDRMNLRIASRFSGKATVAIVSDRVHETRLVDVKAGETQVAIPVRSDWGAGAYAVAFAHRPLDREARRMPGRALGLAWFEVDRDARRLTVDLGLPEKMQPRRPLSIPVRLGGLAPGEEAYVTLAAVDVGILSLTRFEAPDASAYFFGQRQMGVEIRDLYGLLIDGMQGARGAIRSGGDGGAGGAEGNRPTQEPLARYSGVVKVGPDGVANVTFDIPAFNGAMRVMAVAWTKTRVGEASRDVIVRDPVVVQATLPRFLSLGDRSRFHMQVDNVEGAAGDYVVDIDVRGPVSIAADALRRTVRLAQGARTQLSIPVVAAGFGRAEIDLRITGGGVDARQSFGVDVKPGSGELYRRVVRQLAPGESLSVSGDLLADFLPRSGAVSVAVSPWGGIDAPALLQALDRYPYGCTEQTVSRAMPLLYVNRLASQAMLALDDGVEQRVKDAVDRVLSRQDSTGAFGLWSANGAGEDLWLDAFVSDFLTRAREAGYAMPQRAFDQAIDRLRNQVANAGEISKEQGSAIAYALYVLARNGRPVMSDLRYLADTKLAAFETGLAKAQLGAALALLGDRGRAQAVFAMAGNALRESRSSRFSRADYGSRLRDGAGLLALAAEAGADRALLQLAGGIVQQERALSAYASTQEMNWMVLAAQALSRDAQAVSLTVDREGHSGAYYRTWRADALEARAVAIANAGAASAQVVLTTSGHPVTPEPAAAQGYQLERSYFTLDGKPMDMGAVRQNQRFVAVLKVTELEAAYARLLLVDRLPAGLEIDNPRLFEGGSVEALAFAKATVEPAHAEYRDDRFVAAFDRNGSEKAIFHVAYIVRAVTPGRYVHPPATVEDMYRPQRFGRTGYGALDVSEAR
ncbi:MAG: alpha-2-macroglobulin [Hyphomicrobiales bacterium]|nr:alpha-2-macroglobulin [Hyphomicrobiales bacterium]